ncbi:hypothetical protein AB0C02_00980 [Micromonospora sp. NPDC048999]|uniref:SHOCT domain-containing protein n=1 Tax=Micromonospora sp. NPDC048999 TaxID=3155391 RepID=UPI0033D16C0A
MVAVVGITWLFLGMRAVMAIGGSCADGGPYVSARPCPDGAAGTMIGGVFGGLAGLFVYAALGLRAGPRLIWLAWPALFLSLGWNFLDYGLNPAGRHGVDVGLLVVAGVFAAMGGLPLLFLFNRRTLRAVFWADAEADSTLSPTFDARELRDLRAHAVGPDSTPGREDARAPAPRVGPEVGSADELAGALERMHQLYVEGALTADEYAAVKRRLLGREAS